VKNEGVNMTLQEAIKSGKRFKRCNDAYWLKFHGKESPFLTLKEADIFATDWEVEEKKVLVSEAQLVKAIEAVFYLGSMKEIVCNDLACELGLRKRETAYVGQV